MNDVLKYMNCVEKAVAMRVASLALSNAAGNPDRTLRECILQDAERIPEIIEEHCMGMRIVWTDDSCPDRREYWSDCALELLSLVAMYAEDIVEGRSSPDEARTLFRRHVGLDGMADGVT